MEIFDRDAESWWSEQGHCALLRSIIPARLDYLHEVYSKGFGRTLPGVNVLDIGCGGGLFAEEVARLGCRVTGIDPSSHSIEIARQHAEKMELAIYYQVAPGESLPFDADSFDIVYCCDVLEHVSDVNAVIAESGRVLKPDGMFFYDTVNRTRLSKFLMITLFQEWFEIVPKSLHDWNRFIKPKELLEILKRHGLEPCNTVGLIPDMNPLKNIKRVFDIQKLKRNEMSYAQFGQGMMFQKSRLMFLNYMGHAIRNIVNV